MKFPRSAGILLHVSSLPGPLGIGDLGPLAHEFANFLHASGQTIWQILPVCPPAAGNSPYSSYSVLASNSNLISPESMIAEGWGTQADLDAAKRESPPLDVDSDQVDYEAAQSIRRIFFRRAFDSLRPDLPELAAYQEFSDRNRYWLEDFCLFESIARTCAEFNWRLWPEGLARHDADAIAAYRAEHAVETEYSRFLQFVFDFQWQSLKSKCNELGIRIYGDLPIFVDYQSADVWGNQNQFQLDDSGRPEYVAGVPPDYFSETGQKWGNPLYDWDSMEADGFRWWNQRFRRSLDQFDIIRVDHFRGFEAYWRIPADAPSAIEGEWVKGPGEKPFRAATQELGELPIVAEDLGLITKEVDQLREALDFPTMRVMQFGYGSEEDNFHRPGFYPEHCFAYTGTHDNDTVVGWFREQLADGSEEVRQLLQSEFQTDDPLAEPIHWQLVRAVLDSRADSVIIPLQDYLGLGNEARMNLPATTEGNWRWKLRTSDAWRELAPQIRAATEAANR